LPVTGGEEEKRTNEIGMAIPLPENGDIAGKDITGDALLTQRKLARHIVERKAHYHFTAKATSCCLAVYFTFHRHFYSGIYHRKVG
jgi:predicted transposase YbfD/YdcC